MASKARGWAGAWKLRIAWAFASLVHGRYKCSWRKRLARVKFAAVIGRLLPRQRLRLRATYGPWSGTSELGRGVIGGRGSMWLPGSFHVSILGS